MDYNDIISKNMGNFDTLKNMTTQIRSRADNNTATDAIERFNQAREKITSLAGGVGGLGIAIHGARHIYSKKKKQKKEKDKEDDNKEDDNKEDDNKEDDESTKPEDSVDDDAAQAEQDSPSQTDIGEGPSQNPIQGDPPDHTMEQEPTTEEPPPDTQQTTLDEPEPDVQGPENNPKLKPGTSDADEAFQKIAPETVAPEEEVGSMVGDVILDSLGPVGELFGAGMGIYSLIESLTNPPPSEEELQQKAFKASATQADSAGVDVSKFTPQNVVGSLL